MASPPAVPTRKDGWKKLQGAVDVIRLSCRSEFTPEKNRRTGRVRIAPFSFVDTKDRKNGE